MVLLMSLSERFIWLSRVKGNKIYGNIYNKIRYLASK